MDQLQWRQFLTHFTWLDVTRGGTYLHPEAIRPRTLEDSLVDDFFRVLCGSEIPQSSWALATRRSYQAWVTSFCNFCAARRQCGEQNAALKSRAFAPRTAAEARRAEAVVAKRLAQRFVLGVRSGRMY